LKRLFARSSRALSVSSALTNPTTVIEQSAAIARTARSVFLKFIDGSLGARDVVIEVIEIVRDFV
jgi:hypothetical protein